MRRSRTGRARREAPAGPIPARATRPLGLALLIAVVGVLTFGNSFGPFIWDDDPAIVSNKTIQHLWPLSDPLSPPLETPAAGRPLVNLSFALNYAVGGARETGYHAVNIALHIACALLLFAVVRRTLAGSRMPAALSGHADGIASVAALVWMVHPLQSEVVNYVTQRSESLMASFFLLTLYAALRAVPPASGRKAGAAAGSPGAWKALSIGACACGMASKQTMVVAPIIVALYDRAFLFDTWRDAWRQRRTLYAGLAAAWLVLAALVLTSPRSTVGATSQVSAWMYLLNQSALIVRYLWLSVWPRALVLDYGLPRQLSLADVAQMVLLLAVLFAAAITAMVRWPRAGFAAVAFFLTLAPTSSIIPIVSEAGAERRMYLPMMSLVTLAAVGAWSALARIRPRFVAAGVAAVVAALLAVRTIARNAEFASPVTLWQTSVDRYPHGRSRMALATELAVAGQADQAIAQLREALPDFPDARAALGTELVLTGRVDEGAAVLRQFIATDPANVNRIPAHLLLAETQAKRGDLDGAIADLRALVKLAPADVNLRAQLAGALARQGEARLRGNDAAAAEPYAREAVQLTPNDPAVHNLLGAALASTGRFDEAIAEFREALQVAPGDRQARANLERALQVTSTLPPRPRSGESGRR